MAEGDMMEESPPQEGRREEEEDFISSSSVELTELILLEYSLSADECLETKPTIKEEKGEEIVEMSGNVVRKQVSVNCREGGGRTRVQCMYPCKCEHVPSFSSIRIFKRVRMYSLFG
jgi:hypothetical protein